MVKILALLLPLVFFTTVTYSMAENRKQSQNISIPITAKNGMVSSQEVLATRIGVKILRKGGNAIDAAVAVGFALAVTLPRAGNIGGGGFMLIYESKSGKTHAMDYRETAPLAASRDMFLDQSQNFDRKKAISSYKSAGVPGTVAGLINVLQRFGSMPLSEVIRPAIILAKEGIKVTRSFYGSLTNSRIKRLKRWPDSKKKFFKADGSSYQIGDIWKQPDLAWVLQEISDHGANAFYKGEIAERISQDMFANGGLITKVDLKNYRPIFRNPVRGTYRTYEVVSMPPPSSGGVHLIQMLNVIEGFDLAKLGPWSVKGIHIMTEAMKYAYADRSKYLGDPGFWVVPVQELTSKSYASEIRSKIDLNFAQPAIEIKPGELRTHESRDTTHFSVIDKEGNVVSNTYTINLAYGSGIVVAGTGILLNNEMDDFSAKPNVPNSYGLIGGKANAIEAGKRPLSSMTPTIVFRNRKPILITGSPGGSSIISTVLQLVTNVIDHKMNIAMATLQPRYHHQWRPDYLWLEPGFDPRIIKHLNKLGHKTRSWRTIGATQSIMVTAKGLAGYSDKRRLDALTAGY